MSGEPAVPAVVLAYHSISEGPGPLRIAPGELAAQLDHLLASGYEAVPLGRIVEQLEAGRRPFAARTFAITFDDGYRDFGDVAWPILERRSLPATVFVTAGDDREHLAGGIGDPLLPLSEVAALARAGVDIGGHSVGHVDLTGLADADLEREVGECQAILTSRTGRPAAHFAYPFGGFDARVRAAVGAHFRSACTTQLARAPADADTLAIPRIDAFYLQSPLVKKLLESGHPDGYLRLRRWLRRLRGSEPTPAR